ncbi:MAG: VWA domain-containing protein [Saprospiraceae bacterium]
MFRLEHPILLVLLVAIAIAGAMSYWHRKSSYSKLAGLASDSLWKGLLPSLDFRIQKFRSWLWLLGLALVVLSLSNPQWGTRKEKVEIKSTDIYLVLDISNSMLCNDIKPNRLERGKLWAESLIRSLASDRVGIVLFAGHAFLQSPLTTDYGSAAMFVRSASPDLITTQGTNISDAIKTCLENFPKNDEAQKVIVLLSDGEDHDEWTADLSIKAKDQNVAIYTIGTGTLNGGLIPIQTQGLEDYKRDETGKPVQTKLNAEILTSIATDTHGKYYSIEQGDQVIKNIKDDISNMTKQRVAERAYSEYESYFPYLLFPGFILLLAEYLFSIKWFDRFKKTAL